MIAAGALAEPLDLVDPRTVPARFSRLKQMALSPAHYLAAVQSDDDDSLALRLGAGTHAMVFNKPLVKFTGKVRNGKAWEAFEAEHTAAGAVILNIKEYDEASRIAEALLRHPDASALLTTGDIERKIEWTLQGKACRGTPDAFTAQRVVDLKTTRSAEPERFMRDATFRGYHAQLAWYLDGLAEAGIATPSEAYLVAVEKSAAYPVTVLELTERTLDMGRRMYRLWFEKLLVCERSNCWPAYAETVLKFDVEAPTELVGIEWDDDEGPG